MRATDFVRFEMESVPEGSTLLENPFPISLLRPSGREVRDDGGDLPEVSAIRHDGRIVISGMVNLSVDDDVRRHAVWTGDAPSIASLLDAAFAAGRAEGVESERRRTRRTLGL